MAAYEGLDVRFVTDDGQFRGILHSLDGISKKITLRKVTCLDTGKCFPGLLNFYGHEIILLEVLEDGIQKADKASSELKKPSQSYGLLSKPDKVRESVSKSRGQRNQGASILDRHESPKHLKNLRDYDPEKEVLSKKSATEGAADTDTDLKFGTLTVKFGEHDKEYNVDYTLIDTADHVYRAAIGRIKQQKFIAVNMEGVLIGRRGKICIVQVATRQHVYLFDILQLGFACFNQGLGEIFESKDIVKVMHDCRQPSDALFHQYGLKLVNVFDTQVADVIIWRNRNGGDLPRYVRGQVACLLEHMNLTMDQVYFQRVRSKCIETDQTVWTERPVKRYLIEAAVKNVMYLLDLRIVLMECMMEEFTLAVDIYLQTIRDRPNETNARLPSTSHLLPDAIYETSHEMRRMSALNHSRYRGIHHWDENGFRENFQGAIDPGVTWSRDIWHEGRQFENRMTKTSSSTITPRKTTILSPHQNPSSLIKSGQYESIQTSSSELSDRSEEVYKTKMNLSPDKSKGTSCNGDDECSDSSSDITTSSDEDESDVMVTRQASGVKENDTGDVHGGVTASQDHVTKTQGVKLASAMAMKMEEQLIKAVKNKEICGHKTEDEDSGEFNEPSSFMKSVPGGQIRQHTCQMMNLDVEVDKSKILSIRDRLTSILKSAENSEESDTDVQIAPERKVDVVTMSPQQHFERPTVKSSSMASFTSDSSSLSSFEGFAISPIKQKHVSVLHSQPGQFADADDHLFTGGTFCVPRMPVAKADGNFLQKKNPASSFSHTSKCENNASFSTSSDNPSDMEMSDLSAVIAMNELSLKRYSRADGLFGNNEKSQGRLENQEHPLSPTGKSRKLGIGRGTTLESYSEMIKRTKSPKDIYLIRGSMVECNFPLDEDLHHSYYQEVTKKGSKPTWKPH